MRHVRGAFALTLVLVGSAAAQQQATPVTAAGSIVGQVVHAATQRPLQGAQVFVVGAKVGAITNAEGRYTIAGVPLGARLVRFQMVGYGTQEKAVQVESGASAAVNFSVTEQAISIDQIVVTALGIERAEKSLGYAVQSVTSAKLERSPELTFVHALAGQTAGAQVTQSSGQPGSSARLVIRGEGSFRGDGQPLYVIDGMPLTVDIDRNGYDPLLRGEAGSRAMDIDPNNIEEISILRGAAATALYGARAALGAVIIRTKEGTPGAPLRFSLSTRFGSEEPILEGLQTNWAAGAGGFFCNGKPTTAGGWCQPGSPVTDPTIGLSWGPHRDSIPAVVTQHEGQLRFQDPRSDFYNTGLTSTHSLYGTGSMNAGTYGIGFSYTNQEGVFTSSRLDRMNVNANLSLNLSSWLRTRSSIYYASTGNDWGWEGQEGFTALVSVLPPTRDLTISKNEDGTPVMFGSNSPHPQWLAENEYATSSLNRWIAAQTFVFTLGKGVTLSDHVGIDTYLDNRREFVNERPWLTLAGVSNGGTRQQKITRRTLNNDLVLNVDHRPLGAGSFGISGLLGTNIYSSSASDVSGAGRGLGIPGYYQLANFSTRTPTGSLTAYRRLVGLYSQATLDYRDWAFFTLTGRNDWSSTLPEDANSYFYPSASLAVVFTDALGWQSSLLDYGKVRLSVSKVGADAPPYRLASSFVSGAFQDFASGTTTITNLGFPFRNVHGFVVDNNLGNPGIKPERTVEMELGLETRLFNGYARADLSLYHRRSYDQIFSVPVAASTGFKTITQNAGDLRNRGIELSLGVTPLRSATLTWDAQANFTRNWSSVIDLAEDVDFIYLAGAGSSDVRIIEDHPYGVIWGTRYQRNADGQLVIGADGFPLVDATSAVLGEIMPDWLANFGTTVRYRAFSISGLLDVRRGGEILNADLRATIPAGTAAITEQRNDNFTFAGVTAAGQPNTRAVVRDQSFWTRYAAVDENLIESANVVRLREATFSVAIPQRLSRLVETQNMSLFVSGRNLKVWTPFSYGDPDGNNYGSVNAGGVAYRLFTVPNTRTWSVGVRATF